MKKVSRLSNDPQKIMFVLPSLVSGGAERVLITLANNSCPEIKKTLAVIMEKGELGSYVHPSVEIVHLRRGSVRAGMLPLLRLFWERKPDVIVSTMAHMNFAVLLLKPLLYWRPRVLVREANVPSSVAEGVRLTGLVKMAYRVLYPFADLVISPSKKIIEEFKSYLGMDLRRQLLLYNPVDIGHIRSKAQEAFLRLPQDAVQFVCVGRLHRQKGLDRLLPHLRNLPDDFKWNLTIYGTGPEQANLERLIQLHGLEEKVRLAGLTTNPWGAMAGADALLLPSRWEGLPNVVLESLAAGTPVIASVEAGGIAEIAALAAGHVKLCADMDGFVTEMGRVRKDLISAPRESLLPSAFHLETIVNGFRSALSSPDFLDSR